MAAGSRRKCWSGRSRSTKTPRDSVLDSRAAIRGSFRDEARAPLPNFEDVVIAPARITRIDHLVVRRLRLDFHTESVALAANAFDLDHRRDLRRHVSSPVELSSALAR